MTEELKPCPFEGSKDVDFEHSWAKRTAKYKWWVKCYECKTTGPVGDSKDEAIEFWNERIK